MNIRKTATTLGLVIFVYAHSATAEPVLGGGLEQLVRLQETGNPKLASILRRHLATATGEVLVDIRLDGNDAAPAVIQRLIASGFRLQAVSELDPTLVEGFIPLTRARAAAQTLGVRGMSAVLRPRRFAGAVQSEAVTVQRADLAQARGLDGRGIRIGVLADSFDSDNYSGAPTAADNVTSGDIPADVVVLDDLPPGEGSDEGRYMMQVMHDVAPGATMGFATAFKGLVSFSNNILALRRTFHADVIVDDVQYFDEPMYSDGLLARTVDQVVAEGAAYFSAAGNDGDDGYEDLYRPISPGDAKKLIVAGHEGIHLDEAFQYFHGVPASLHTFRDTDGQSSISKTISTYFDTTGIEFQWDEPFGVGKVQTDLDVLVFDDEGHFIPPDDDRVFYTADNNPASDAGREVVFLGAIHRQPPNYVLGQYRIVIVNWNGGPARRLKQVVISQGLIGVLNVEHETAPSIWGHAAARGGRAVAAMSYNNLKFPDDYSAHGPVTIYLDTAGNRLPQPEVRQVPQITGIDYVQVAVPDPTAETGFQRFFGTSCAAPNVAAVAALVLQSAGGPESLTPTQVYDRLERTATPIPVSSDRQLSAALAGPIAVTMHGDASYADDYFTVSMLPLTGRSVTSISISVTDPDLRFLPDQRIFRVGDTHGIAASQIHHVVSNDLQTLTLSFPGGGLRAGDSFSFGIDSYSALEYFLYILDADRYAGAVVTVTLDDGTHRTGTVAAAPKAETNPYTGAGLVNADQATRP